MTRMRWSSAALPALGLAILSVGAAHAGTVDSYSGYGWFGAPCPLCDSFVNFAVYHNTDGDWTDDAFFGGNSPTPLADLDGEWGAVVDSGATFVFLFQVVNNTANGDNPLRVFALSRDEDALPTSAGFFPDAVFSDVEGNTVTGGPTGDYSLDEPDPPLADVLDTPNDGAPAVRGVAPTGLVSFDDPGPFDPVTVRSGNLMSNPDVDGGALFPSVLWDWGTTDQIPSCPPGSEGCTSSVLFLTSDLAPDFLWAETESPGGFGAAGDVAFPSPNGFPGCKTAARNKLRLSAKRDRIKWKWWRGEAVDRAEFGDPIGGDEYVAFVFDARDAVLSVVADVSIRPGAVWREKNYGLRFRTGKQEQAPGGPRRLKLVEGSEGKSRINLDGRDVSIPDLPLRQDPEVAIQLVNLANGNCWESRFEEPPKANDEGRFRDKIVGK